jgi:hypothetical protein
VEFTADQNVGPPMLSRGRGRKVQPNRDAAILSPDHAPNGRELESQARAAAAHFVAAVREAI